ncbi:MAG: DUF167 domain-containing protein [Planctomycetota bacterium]
MTGGPIALREVGGEVWFAVKVVPGAARERLVGPLGDALKIAVTAPPEGGKANAAVVAVLAHALGVPVRAVRVVSGQGSPRKVVAVAGISAAQVASAFAALAPSR